MQKPQWPSQGCSRATSWTAWAVWLDTSAQASCAAPDSISLTVYLPCLQLSLVEMPQYDFALEVYGGKAALSVCTGGVHREPCV